MANPVLKLSAAQIAGAAIGAGFSQKRTARGSNTDVEIAVAIALAESGGNTFAHNAQPPDNSYGLWQINMYGDLGKSRRDRFGLKANNDLFNPATNAKVAKFLRDTSGGWTHWSVYRNGSYWLQLPAARQGAAKPEKPPIAGTPFDDEGGVKQDDAIASGLLDTLFDPIINFIKEIGLRLAGFIGGVALLIAAIVLVAKRGIK